MKQMKIATRQSKAKNKNPHWGSSLDEFLQQEGTREAFQAVAIKKILVSQSHQRAAARRI